MRSDGLGGAHIARENVLQSLMSSLLSIAPATSEQQWREALAVAIFFGFIAIALLLPDFDGSKDEDWDMQGRTTSGSTR